MGSEWKMPIGLNKYPRNFDIRVKSNRKRQDFVFAKLPGDKSISQRAVVLNAIAEGRGVVRNILRSADTWSCIRALRLLGVKLVWDGEDLWIDGVGLTGLRPPGGKLDIGNTATSARLLMSLLAGSAFSAELSGNRLLTKRPMDWVVKPLMEMGAKIKYLEREGALPIKITGTYPLRAIEVDATVPSAQEKSAVLFAGLFADGTTQYRQQCQSRDHTERLMRYFGIDIVTAGQVTSITGGRPFAGKEVQVPGDISSAAYLLTAYAIRRNEEKGDLKINDVGVNPTRLGYVNVLKERGVHVTLENCRMLASNEPVADICCRPGPLPAAGQTEGVELIQSLIDEVPLLAAISAFASGVSIIKDCGDLKDKDTNRLETTAKALVQFGVDAASDRDQIKVVGAGGGPLQPAVVDSCGDHRIAMMAAVLASSLEAPSVIRNCGCISVSYPSFLKDLSRFADIEILV